MEDIRDGKACGSCHSGRTTESRGRHVASPIEDCGNCHMPAADIIFKLNRMDPVKFSHVKHLSVDLGKKVSNPTGFSCADCHPTPFDRLSKESFRMAVPHENGGCARCHNGRKRNGGLPPAFAATTRCLTCHKPTSSDMRP
jgi:c(7)-type cytochrome triheme protein